MLMAWLPDMEVEPRPGRVEFGTGGYVFQLYLTYSMPAGACGRALERAAARAGNQISSVISQQMMITGLRAVSGMGCQH